MEANQITDESQANANCEASSVTGRRVSGWPNRMFGCWHKEMSRPFSDDGQSYRVCLTCGARRDFNLKRWQMQGEFYYNLPTSKHFRVLNGLTPQPPKLNTRLGIAPASRQFA